MPPQLQNDETDAGVWSDADHSSTASHSSADLVAQLLRPEPDAAVETKHESRELSNDVMGANAAFRSPFGTKLASFADYSEGGRAFQSVENFIRQHALPLLFDSPVSSSAADVHAASFVEIARRAVADTTNAFVDGPDATDYIFMTDSGSAGASDRLMADLGLCKTSASSVLPDASRPVVLLGPFEHSSDTRRWQESAAEVVCIPESTSGHVDLEALEQCLEHYEDRRVKIGVFTAASSLTGMLTDVDGVTELLHRHSALAVWDYSSAAAHVSIDMNPDQSGTASLAKDAVFFTGHKLVGAPSGPNVLIVKKTLLSSPVTASLEADAVGSLRLGLALQLKQTVGVAEIAELECRHVSRARASLAESANIVVLGHDDAERHRLPLFSFLVRAGDRFLHYNFVHALLSDLFGVQIGVTLEGRYGAQLLGLSPNDRLALERAVEARNGVLRPGFLHMSLPYFVGDAEADYILEAVRFVASDGWKFLPQYKFDRCSGEWTHRGLSAGLQSQELYALSSADRRDQRETEPPLSPSELSVRRERSLRLARSLARQCDGEHFEDFCSVTLDVSLESLRWFVYPVEAVAALRSPVEPEPSARVAGPFQPDKYMAANSLAGRWTLLGRASKLQSAPRRSRLRTRERLGRLVRFCARLSRCRSPRHDRDAAATSQREEQQEEERRATFAW